jgi:hypothetical protein
MSEAQSAFVKGRSIQDNYQYIHGEINHFNGTKTPMLFLKLDISGSDMYPMGQHVI